MQHDFTAQAVTIYCLCDDFLRAWGHADAPQARITCAEVMTVALVAAAVFCGNQDLCRCVLKQHGYIKHMPSKGHLNRRLHQVPPQVWQALLRLLAQVHQQASEQPHYIVDSLPVPVCDNWRIRRCRLYPQRQYGLALHGYIASKRRYFYGLRLHLIVTADGLPVEAMLAAGAEADIAVLRRMTLDLPPGAVVLADKGYQDQHEQALFADAGRQLLALRRSNSREPLPAWLTYIVQQKRKRIETVFSQIARAFGRGLHAVTPQGFELKVFLTVLAYAITHTL